ncbi:hypothetical protein OG393_30935 [Streptomyces sp. NBC_01216]|uniref:hypothetical protein n=1 Tax=Streptomyces sp. NBC_01216 TaxID=2903778 RepID=UPI002E10B8FC|nr:hypothetical protein OG393_30935 [Streptomyces sp. NBC_01216]
MTPATLTRWASEHPAAATTGAALALTTTVLLLWLTARTLRRRTWPPTPVLVAAAGAAVCTAYSADTSWRFAAHQLGMRDITERLVMFAAAELALFGWAVIARANKRATATAETAGSPGAAGALMWVITGVQVIPAYSESGIVGGTVRAVIGPLMAALLWHQAMGLEIRMARPATLSTGLLAVLGREARTRLLSYLGVAARNRTAEQITRDRATARAVRLASRPTLRAWGRRRLEAAVARAGVGADEEQRTRLLEDLAARRHAIELATVPLTSPWTGTPAPAPEPGPEYARTPLGVTGAELRTVHPLDAVRTAPAELASLCTEYGVPVSEAQVRVATVAGPTPPARAAAPRRTGPATAPALHLDLVTGEEVHPEARCRVPVLELARPPRGRTVHARVDAPATAPDDLMSRARVIDDEYREKYGRVASIRALKTGLGVAQDTARQVQDRLRDNSAEARPSPVSPAASAGS